MAWGFPFRVSLMGIVMLSVRSLGWNKYN